MNPVRTWLVLIGCLLAPAAHAAAAAQALTPIDVSVPGNESKVFSVRFLDASGAPAVNESVQFLNDACGTFPGGAAVANVRTDANGVASATFTAFNQGITCWLTATAGAQVRFNVLTFTKAQVYFAATLEPLAPRPGQAYTVTASPMAGLYRLYDQDVTARVIAGTASASLSPGSGNTGSSGSVAFQVTPDAHVGDYDIEFDWRGRTQRLAMKAPAAPWQDLWWAGAAENGWGMSIVQHRDLLFSVIYAYDGAGKPIWYVMPGGTWNSTRESFIGPLYRPHGTPFSAYDASKLAVGDPVGRAALTMVDGGTLVLDYTIDGVAGRKTITRQPFGPQDPTPLPEGFGDMWWGGAAQNGWGIALLQQYRALFGVWFTYDAQGAPTWFVMPSGSWSDATTWQARLFRTTGSPWLGAAYDARAFKATDVGSLRIRFANGAATADYSIDGLGGTLALSHQPF
jgi:hypothetical protein